MQAAGPQQMPDKDLSLYVAPQWKLIWWKFRKHRLAVFSAVVVLLIYGVALTAEFFAPFDPEAFAARYTYAPPQPINWFHEGQFMPHVNGYQVEVNTESMSRTFVLDEEQVIPIRFFAEGHAYKLLGLIDTNIHLVGPVDEDDPMFLLGADRLGRDVLSRIIYGARISMSIGLIGVTISLVIGIILGGISGYYGGWVDNLIQRLIEFIRSLPTIPLWMALAAALPLTWPPLQMYLAITIILSFIGWTDLARVVRSRYLSLRGEDFVTAVDLDGASQQRIMFRHMLPAFYSHIIASLTLAIPGMILAETALSFLGLGLRPPTISWGVLLQEAQNLRSVATAPWLLTPAIAVIVAVLALNFLGDGIRDAADPYM
ncbi:MAG: peptide ABC transporter permease [Anaerolineaceae bacterium]|nr:peptide ABC transporter permease [Anaerolineaceae bacterium]